MNICLFGAGSKNIDKKFLDIGYELGALIAQKNHNLVFGGGNDGMMGSVARGVSDNNGKILGIIPEWMIEFEDLYESCDDVIYTRSMDERKMKFIEYSDSFLVTPGGVGTLDEFFEVLTLKKLNLHNKPIIILNIDNFFDKMLDMLYAMIEEGFVPSNDEELFIVTSNINDAIDLLC